MDRRRDRRRPAGLAGAFVLAAYGTVAVSGPSAAAPGGADCAALAAQMRALAGRWAEAALTRRQGNDQLAGSSLREEDSLAGLSLLAPMESSPEDAVGNGPTGTNVVERGVDEPDVAKVDGTRVLVLRAQRGAWRLSVVETAGGSPVLLGEVASRVRAQAEEMFVLPGHRVLVLGTGGGGPGPGAVVATLVDTADGARPTVLRSLRLTGRYVSARLSDGVVRVVTSGPPSLLSEPDPVGFEPRRLTAARLRAGLQRHGGEDWLPVRQILDARGRVVSAGPAMGCADVFRPADPHDPVLLSVLAIDTSDGAHALDLARGSGVVGGADVVYATDDRLYAADAADGGTTIHAFDTAAGKATPHVATVRVRGEVARPSPFSPSAQSFSPMSARGGYLRVAVTEPARSVNRVLVLAERPGRGLVQVGRTGGIGVGERIKAVRWFDALAGIVTFRQTDPLYVVDLSAPTRPAVVGRLEVPGYSGYLHPVGGGRLLGVGRAGDAAGRLGGVQVSVFDLADPAYPERSDNKTVGGGLAGAERDARAFTFLPARNLAVVHGLLGARVDCTPDHGHGPACWTADGRLLQPPRRTGRPGVARVPAVVGLHLDALGHLREVGRRLLPSAVLRVLPVGDLLAVVTGAQVVLLDPADLAEVGAADL